MPGFKVMTWNVENLFRPALGTDPAPYQDKLALLSVVITGANPDVVALQEIGGEEPVHDLQEALAGLYPHRAVSNFPDGRGIRVAFISQLPLMNPQDLVDFPPGPALEIHGIDASGATSPILRMGRGALHVRVTKGTWTIDLITAHLKSKLLTFPRPWGSSFEPASEDERAQAAGIALMRRSAEAVTLRIRANSLLVETSDRPMVVLGDFNDVPEAQTSLLLHGPAGSELGTGGFDRPDKGDDARLFNLALLIPEERRFSRIHRGRRELLDQIFASEELFPRLGGGIRQTPTVDSLVDFRENDALIASVTDNPTERVGEVAPDHAPVVAEFEL